MQESSDIGIGSGIARGDKENVNYLSVVGGGRKDKDKGKGKDTDVGQRSNAGVAR